MKELFNRLEDFGRIREKLNNVLEETIFEDLSEDNWYFKDFNPDVQIKLEQIRTSMAFVEQCLYEILDITIPKESDEF